MDSNGNAVDDWPKLVNAGFSRSGATLLRIADCVAAAEHILLFLDFDGTLAPIVPDPKDGRLSEATRRALLGLAADDAVTLIFISGRSLVISLSSRSLSRRHSSSLAN